jgi:hypothetical protein
VTDHDSHLSVESKGPQRRVAIETGVFDMARKLVLVESPQPTSVCIPAPRMLVRHLASGALMGTFPVTEHQLAREVARRWRGSVELLPVEPSLSPTVRASRKGGTK